MNTEEMTATEFRRAYGVPVSSLPHVRQSLTMEREALREVYGDHWRDAFEEIADEFNGDDDDASENDSLTLTGGDLLMEARGWRRSLTAELVDGFED